MRVLKLRKYVSCLFSFLIAASVLGCGKEQKKTGPMQVPVSAVQAAREDVLESLHFVGDIKARDEAVLYSKVTGKLIEYTVQEGDAAAKDQTVATVDRDEVGFKYQEALVKSTIAGTVGRTYLDRGADIRLDTPVALIVDMKEMKVLVNIPERHVPKIHVGQAALLRVDAYPGEVFQGRVVKASPVIHLQTRTAPIEVAVANPQQRLKPGMFARVELVTQVHEDAHVVPEEAIAYRGQKLFVYVVEEGKAHERVVTLGVRKAGKVQIVDGLEGGELVVTAGHQKIRDGAAVAVKEIEKQLTVTKEDVR